MKRMQRRFVVGVGTLLIVCAHDPMAYAKCAGPFIEVASLELVSVERLAGPAHPDEGTLWTGTAEFGGEVLIVDNEVLLWLEDA